MHIVSGKERPVENIFGKEIGDMLNGKHKEHGIKLHMNNGVERILKN